METESSVTVQRKMDFKKILTFSFFLKFEILFAIHFHQFCMQTHVSQLFPLILKKSMSASMITGVVFISVKIPKAITRVAVRTDLNWTVTDTTASASIFFIFCYLIYFHLVFTFKKVIEIDAGIFTINFYNVNVFTRGTHIYLDNGASLLILCSQLKMQRCVQFFADKNECLQNKGGCHHQCLNTLGGYECKCNAGYSLSKDGRSCQCKS